MGCEPKGEEMKLFIVMLATSLFLMGCPQAQAKPTSTNAVSKPKTTAVKIKKIKLTKKQLEYMRKVLRETYKKRYGELPSD